MNIYSTILVAVDLSQDSAMILDKARNMAKKYEAQLSMIHVMEPIAVGYALEVSSLDIEGLHEDAARQARTSLLELGTSIGIPENRLHTVLGQPAREIKELASNIDADLLIMGGHNRSGWELLFGSTASGVSHGVECDLLIVHIQE